MEQIMPVIGWVMANYEVVLGNAMAILMGLIGISLLIPGDVPEKQLQVVVDFLKKFSKK